MKAFILLATSILFSISVFSQEIATVTTGMEKSKIGASVDNMIGVGLSYKFD